MERFLMQEKIGLTGTIHLVLKDRDGKIKEERVIKNLIVNAGKAEVAALIGAVAGGVAFGYIAIGTGTTAPAAANTTLEAEITTGGGARAASVNTQVTTTVTNDTLQAVKTFTFTLSFAVTESGLFNDATAGDMLARQTFSVINVANGDTLTVTWKIAVS